MQALLALAEQTDQAAAQLPAGLVVETEVTLRRDHLARLAEARKVLEARAAERYAAEQADYEAKLRARAEQAESTGQKPRGREPQPPEPGPRAKDQYNFTDPESRIMKNSNNAGFDQHYNAEVMVDQESLLIVGAALSNHPNDKQEVVPGLEAIAPTLGTPEAAAFDNGFFSEANITKSLALGVEPYIATGREPHHPSWQAFFAEQAAPPAADASPKVQMAYKLQTEVGRAIYRARKSTVEPVIGLIKEVLGFRQFSLRGLTAAAGEWSLVCLAFNLKRLHVLYA